MRTTYTGKNMDSETTGRIARFIRLLYRISLFLGLLSGLWLGLLVYFASTGNVFPIQLTIAIVGFVGFFGLSIPLYLVVIMWEGMAKQSKEWETEVLASRRSREG
jgi:ABC-type methionine transport system permease subunit